MRTFIIIDRLGSRHATIKAATHYEAIKAYHYGKITANLATNVFAIDSEDLDLFKKQINSL